MLFTRKRFQVKNKDLPMLLGEDGISEVIIIRSEFVRVIPKGRFDVKPWLRFIELDIMMGDKMEELSGRVDLLLGCPAVQNVEVVLHGGRTLLKRAIASISSAFKDLAKKLGPRLTFSGSRLRDKLLITRGEDYRQVKMSEKFTGDLVELETVARDKALIWEEDDE